MLRWVLAAVLATAGSSLLAEDEYTPPVGEIPRVQRAPTLADYVNGTPREAEYAVSDFRQNRPGDGTPASQPTEAFISYDDKNIYIAFICKEEPGQLRARVGKRDQLGNDDRVNVLLDTFHDHRHMYWFDANPYGIQAEGNFTEGVEDDESWDTLWYSDAEITDDGYVVLFTIPFKSLRFPADGEQTWGVALARWIIRNNEFSVWPEVRRSRTGFAQQAADMTIRDISPGRNIQFIPYGLFSRSRFLDTASDAPQFRSETETRGGLDAKMVFRDALTLDVTLNPDFSQVESDEPQVTVNQRYEVFFPEKRPFFMENAGYFKTPQQLFFSRRIIDPQYGARLTGKIGGWSLGALVVDDEAPGRQVTSDSSLSGKRALAGVVRIQRDLWKDSSGALMVTNRDFGYTYNRVLSADIRLRLLPNWILTGQAISTETRLESGEELSAPGYLVSWEHQGRHLISSTYYHDRGPGFRADLGYIPRVDIREVGHSAGYLWRPEGGLVQSFGPIVDGSITYNREGRRRDWTVNPAFQLNLIRNTQLSIERMESFELYTNRGYRWHYNEVYAQSDWTKWLGLSASFRTGTGINYYPASGIDPFVAREWRAEAGVLLRPNKRTVIVESYLYSGLRTDDGASIFDNHIVRSHVNYQFDARTSMRAIVDYNGTLPNSQLVSLERDKHIGLDLLFTYMLNPGTAFHVGYVDMYDNLRLDPTQSPELYRTSFPDLNTGRQFFVKLSYLFRY